MVVYFGSAAFSSFRLARIQSACQQQVPELRRLTAQHYYFVDSSRLDLATLEGVATLLNSSVVTLPSDPPFVLVVPRLGTSSPWSSKATDILHNCGLTAVKRLEIGVLWRLELSAPLALEQLTPALNLLYDPLTQSLLTQPAAVAQLFATPTARPYQTIPLLEQGEVALIHANQQLGLALSPEEIGYLLHHYTTVQRNPTDAELMMFAQANSEHCRHKIFRAQWVIDDQPKLTSLFGMIRNTYQQHPQGVLTAYSDNSAVITGEPCQRFYASGKDQHYAYHKELAHTAIKVETHNHPTAIAPFAGAATGAGGEIRDEGATGRGAKPKAGLVGFTVSNLYIPGYGQPWELTQHSPPQMASALTIMLEGPIGAAAFTNEFGRPTLCGYFRTYEQQVGSVTRGYHKPIMIAGGLGVINQQQVKKNTLPVGAKILVLGGPGLLIGIGGGAASSLTLGERSAELDFASVQRANAELERRCQEVIDACVILANENPIITLHDVGAGGLSNAVPELLNDSERGGRIELRAIPNDDPGMSPLEIWCNEAQERYVLGVAAEDLARFSKIAERERCPFAVIGEATQQRDLVVYDAQFDNYPVLFPLTVLLGNPPTRTRHVYHKPPLRKTLIIEPLTLQAAAERVLQLPAVADKTFLITIADRSVGGLVVRDQMVGPWQIPVADVAVTAAGYLEKHGEAMAIGERSPLAVLNPAASARMAVGEAVTNLAAAPVSDISAIKLSANWMAASGYPGEEAALYDAVQAIGEQLCPILGICIPVGKDSLSMRTCWQDAAGEHEVVSPVSLVISAFAPVTDTAKTLTPQLVNQPNTRLLVLDLGEKRNSLGGSALAQVYQQLGDEVPDLVNPQLLKNFFAAIQHLNQQGYLLAYHDRSDGGLFTTLCEMAFAGHCGIDVALDGLGNEVFSILFSEELGAVIQVTEESLVNVTALLVDYDLGPLSQVIGTVTQNNQLQFTHKGEVVLAGNRTQWHRLWSKTSYHLQSLRDNPECAKQAYDNLLEEANPGLQAQVPFSLDSLTPYLNKGARPAVAILREQGVNGQTEMAAAFYAAGFTCIDIPMSDLLAGRQSLADCVGLAACGGFSYGDVLGAGRGWAKTILGNARASDLFQQFFERPDTFSLGVCNGCQMMAQLSTLIPGSDYWPKSFAHNESAQYEARQVMVEVLPSASILFRGMIGAKLPVVVAHGEGLAQFGPQGASQCFANEKIALRYIDNYGKPTQRYPYNPNGSTGGFTAFTTTEGRVTIMMPHPERVVRTAQCSWHPSQWPEYSPWLRLFQNARSWVGG